MFFHRLNVRQLAELCGTDYRGRPRHLSTISHLHSGVRDTCSVILARRIEEALRMHPGALFMPVVSTVKDDAPQIRSSRSKIRKKAPACS